MSNSQKRRNGSKKVIKSHKLSYGIILALLVIVAIISLVTFGKSWSNQRKQADYQKNIQDFYEAPWPLPSTTPGHVIRSEKMDIDVPRGGTAYRVLYVTQTPSGEPVPVSGLVFVPPGDPPEGGRKIVAWGHGTLGFAKECAPSRSFKNPMNDMQNWLDGAMQRGYVVTTSDYVGVGTSGTPYYLVGKSEANDVINSVRAARNMTEVGAGNEFIAWGHSQGGHSALHTALEASEYAPELKLVAVAAAAPAAELGPLFSQQYNSVVAWAIGPDAAVSWPEVYPGLPLDAVLTKGAQKQYKKLAYKCLVDQKIGLVIRAELKTKFFSSNPLENPAWIEAIAAETPNVADITVPIYVTQSLSDVVVLPNTTALLAEKACQAGKKIELNWVGNSSHQLIAVQAGPNVMEWMQDRFAGLSPPSSCDQPLPITPATEI